MVPGRSQGHLVGNHLPTGLWAPWGSPHPPWSPQVWVSEDSPLGPLFCMCRMGGGRRLSGLPGPVDPVSLMPHGKAQGCGSQRLRGSSQAVASKPCPHPTQREIWAGGHSGWFPTSPSPPPRTFILHKRLVPRDKLIHTAAWLCVLSCGPRGHLGSSRPSGAGLPGLPLKVGGSRSGSPATLEGCTSGLASAFPFPQPPGVPGKPWPRQGDNGECQPPRPPLRITMPGCSHPRTSGGSLASWVGRELRF